ncbi:hypothetical protein QTP86_000463 [Hemibagrus guttatus]|nr:hypothetical protein QTP86_000463 [Hemibagrus guttatus]
MAVVVNPGLDRSEESCRALSSVFSSKSSSLRELDLNNNKLQDSGVKLLSAGLKNPHCTLEKLRMSYCSITDEGCAALASALRSNSSSHLRELDLYNNNPGESGVKLLSDLLKDPLCTLETLQLFEPSRWPRPERAKRISRIHSDVPAYVNGSIGQSNLAH